MTKDNSFSLCFKPIEVAGASQKLVVLLDGDGERIIDGVGNSGVTVIQSSCMYGTGRGLAILPKWFNFAISKSAKLLSPVSKMAYDKPCLTKVTI